MSNALNFHWKGQGKNRNEICWSGKRSNRCVVCEWACVRARIYIHIFIVCVGCVLVSLGFFRIIVVAIVHHSFAKHLNVHFSVNGGCIFTQIQSHQSGTHSISIYDRFFVVFVVAVATSFSCISTGILYFRNRPQQQRRETREKKRVFFYWIKHRKRAITKILRFYLFFVCITFDERAF